MASKDQELLAISSIINLLTPLDSGARSRVLEYVLKRLDMGTVDAAPAITAELRSQSTAGASSGVMDIRTLTAEKQPRSANEMVVLIAYYLSELAPEGERSATVNAHALRKYFKQARFPVPRVANYALVNAKSAGYLESVSRGEYRLSPVGYNLIVHRLPRSGEPGPAKAALKWQRGKRRHR
jgi:hypothetical protein